MLEINVREARKKLSELLDRVAGGEDVMVLRRGKAIARMSRPETPRRQLPSLVEFRAQMTRGQHPAAQLLGQERDER